MTTPAALRRAASVGPYFDVQVGAGEGVWRPFADLLEPGVIIAEVDAVIEALAARAAVPPASLDRRDCASTYFLGLMSRVISPAFGAAVLAGHVPAFEPGNLAWQQARGGPLPLAFTGSAGLAGGVADGVADGVAGGVAVGDPATAATALHASVISRVVAPLEAVFEATFDLSPQVLWGNAASAVAGAAIVLRSCGQAGHFDPRALAEAVTSRGALAGMGRWTSTGFARNNCCLFYRIPGGGPCGDCVLTTQPR